MVAKFVRFIRIFFSILVVIAPNLYANEWLLSRDNSNRTKQIGPYNTPSMQIQKPYIAPNLIANHSANTPKIPIAKNCWIRRCIHYPQPYPKPTYPKPAPRRHIQPLMPQARFTPQIQSAPQIQANAQMPQQIQVRQTQIQATQITPKPAPIHKPKPKSKASHIDSRLDSSAKCDELENPCGDYECIYQIGLCRKSTPKINSKPQPKAWIDEMRLLSPSYPN